MEISPHSGNGRRDLDLRAGMKPARGKLRARKQRVVTISEAGVVVVDGFVKLPPDLVAILKVAETAA